MNSTTEQTAVKSRILKTESVEWKKLHFIQQEGFKDFSAKDRARLKQSILNNDFIQPFYVWEAPDGIIYCLDGFHRVADLKEIESENIRVPYKLPAVFVACRDIEEAAKLVLLYSSQYARINKEGFDAFMEQYSLDEELLKMQISIPGLTDMNVGDFQMDLPDELIAEPKDKPATVKITFDSADDVERAKPLIEKLLADQKINFLLSVSAGEI
jgi:hypothetical protein